MTSLSYQDSAFPYRYVRLSRKCRAFVNRDGISNVGVILSDEGPIVIDSTMDPSLAREVVLWLRKETGRPPITLIYTHFHQDHTFGSGAMACQGPVIGHSLCASFMAKYLPPLWNTTPQSHKFELCFPNMLVTRAETVLESKSAPIRILHTGGHTHDSCLVFFPEEGILFAGDMVFNRIPPYAGPVFSCLDHFGKISLWIAGLKTILDLKPKIILPGHGIIANRRDIEKLLKFFEYYASKVEEGIRRGERFGEIWMRLFNKKDFLDKNAGEEVYLHMTMGYYDELTGSKRLYVK